MSDQFLVGFPACLKAEPVQIFRFVIEVATDAAPARHGSVAKSEEKARRKSSCLSGATRTTIRSRIMGISSGGVQVSLICGYGFALKHC